jgi:hypothetical protein
MTKTETDSFKAEIIEYVKEIYSLILEDYEDVLSEESKEIIKNFNYEEDIVIDEGGKFSKGPGRWENKTKKLHLSPELFNKTTYKKGMEVEVNHIPLDNIISKLKNSSNETFSGEELANLVRQKNLTYLDVTKGVVIHEIFHSIIHMKSDEEIFSINYDGKLYDCRGVKGELLDEGLVEYYARKFADRHNLFIFPSIPYQSNVEYAKLVEKKIGKNTDKLVFNGNYKTVLNYIHEPNFLESYHILENDWLQTRIVDRLKIAESKNDFYDFGEVEELKLA